MWRGIVRRGIVERLFFNIVVFDWVECLLVDVGFVVWCVWRHY